MMIFCETVDKQCLGAFAKLQRATEIYFVPVCPSAWNKLLPNGGIFMKFDISGFVENMSRKFGFY
jgi:hypothetical protein